MIADARIKNRTTIQQAEKADAQEAKRDAQASIDAFSRGLLSPQTPESGALEPQVIPTSKVLASQFTTDPDQGKQDLLAASLAPDSRIKKIDAGKVPAFNGLPSPSLSIADTPSVDPKLET